MSLLLSDDPELRRYGTPLGRKASYNAAYPYKGQQGPVL